MYGLEQIHMTVPADPSVRPYATGTSFGPKRKMTELDNNSISAIGVLATPDPGRIALYVYHNKYALVPLKPALLAKYASDQYELETEVPGRTASWRKCDA
jgi:hypothetical protein